jgi:uncharacterized peroxidase-related enzyme
MAHIRTVADDEATGLLEKIYVDARERAGQVYNILRIQSLNPGSLRACMALYRQTTLADSALSRGTREMLATVVSKTNGCVY